MRLLLVLALISAAATRVEAGMICMAREDFTSAAADLEGFAKDKRNAVDPMNVICLRSGLTPDLKDVQIPATFKARVEKACTTILARDPANPMCVELAVRLGTTELGGVKLIDAALGWKLDVWNWDGPQAALFVLGQLGDPRGATKLVETWKANLDIAKKREKRSSAMQAWAGWRKEAAQTIGTLGGADDAAFLREQAAATKDRHVRKSCLDAAAMIDKRSP